MVGKHVPKRQIFGEKPPPGLPILVLAAMDAGAGAAACDVAALLSERDFVSFAPGEQDSDLRLRLEIVHDLAPKNAALLAERDRLQAEIDAWAAHIVDAVRAAIGE